MITSSLLAEKKSRKSFVRKVNLIYTLKGDILMFHNKKVS